MRVLWVSLGFATDAGLSGRLAEYVDLTVAGPTTDQRSAPGNDLSPKYGVVRLKPRALAGTNRLAWVYRGIGDLIDNLGPDVVHLVCEPWGLPAVQLARLLRGRAAVLTLHTCDTMWYSPGFGSRPKRSLRRALAGYTLARTQGLAAETKEAIEQSQMGGLQDNVPTAVIHTNPKDPAVFRPSHDADERTRDRAAMGVPTEGIGVGFLGRLVPEKGPLLFLEALQASGLLLRHSGVWAAIAGRGPLEVEVAARSKAPGVHFLGGLHYASEVARFFRGIDIFVAPSWKTEYWEDQSPRSVIEAMLSGCVVVGSDSGAIPSMIKSHGVVVAEKDVPALADGIRQALALRTTDIGYTARISAIERYSTQEEAPRLLTFWQECKRTGGRV